MSSTSPGRLRSRVQGGQARSASARRRHKKIGDLARTGLALVGGSVAAVRHRAAFDDVRVLCLFLGYPRSGHSVVGSLLSAHPDMVIAHELRIHRLPRFRLPRRMLFGMILDNDRRFTRQGRRWTGYEMAVPDQWQGRYRRLRVVGDKRGGNTAKFLSGDPARLTVLRARVGTPLRFVHVVRDPYDNIATIADRTLCDLDSAITKYATTVQRVATVRARLAPAELCDVHLEDLVRSPEAEVATLCAFLGAEPVEEYLAACARVVFDRPSRSRENYDWSTQQLTRVEALCSDVSFLRRYAGQ